MGPKQASVHKIVLLPSALFLHLLYRFLILLYFLFEVIDHFVLNVQFLFEDVGCLRYLLDVVAQIVMDTVEPVELAFFLLVHFGQQSLQHFLHDIDHAVPYYLDRIGFLFAFLAQLLNYPFEIHTQELLLVNKYLCGLHVHLPQNLHLPPDFLDQLLILFPLTDLFLESLPNTGCC